MIINQTTNQVLSKQEQYCKSFLSQAIGLMFKKKQDLVIVFPKEKMISLHMFFVFYPIDVFLLNENQEVVEIRRNFRPFTFYQFSEKAKYIIETPKLNQETRIKDKIIINN